MLYYCTTKLTTMIKLFILSSILFAGSAFSQVLQEDNFDTYPIGNLGNLGGWERNDGSSLASQATIAEVTASTHGRSLKFPRTNNFAMWVSKSPAAFASAWAARTPGNEIIKVVYDHYTGTGTGFTEARFYTTTKLGELKIAASVKFTGAFSSWYVKTNNSDDAPTSVATGTASAWNKVIINYNSVTGSVVYNINGTEYGPYTTISGDPTKVDFYTSGSSVAPTTSAIDNYKVEAVASLTVPNCTTITSPAQGATNIVSSPIITWPAAEGSAGYKVYIGTATGVYNVVNGTKVTTTSYNAALSSSTKYFVKIVPTNMIGDASGCSEVSFTTKTPLYCTAGATYTGTGSERINKVEIKDAGGAIVLSHSSPENSGYSDNTSVIGNVEKEKVYSFTATPNANGQSRDIVYVWVDYNQDGDFDDENERVIVNSGKGPWIGTFTIPANARPGKTRMRIRLTDTFSSAHTSSPCGNTTVGDVEDYTLNIGTETLGLYNPAVNKLLVYPNPFKDVLKISDVKNAASITVSDLSGRIVADVKPTADLNLSALNKGLYIINVKYTNGTLKSIKVIKE